MKALDIPTNTLHNVVSIDYDNNIVVLESEKYGRTGQTIDNVRLFLDKKEDMKGKTIIHPKAFWMIPLVGWFMTVYKLFTIKDCVIVSDKLHHQLYMMVSGFGPILLYVFLLYLSVK